MAAVIAVAASSACGAPLRAGVGRVEITDRDRGPVNDPSFAKALVLSDGSTSRRLAGTASNSSTPMHAPSSIAASRTCR